jgi:hypothetical protein
MEGLQRDEDMQLVIGLALRLLEPLVRAPAVELDKLLHQDFVEFGSSGRSWDRSETITSLTSGQPPGAGGRSMPWKSLVPGWPVMSCMVTYLSLRKRQCGRRSSIWCRTDAGWRLYFHQGAPARTG